MSRARAPGKLVLSGAYAVLSGAPALVVAVDRYVTADSAKAPTFITPEVRAAIASSTPPHFDAEGLRENGRKLGLGSSAAILVASLAALALDAEPRLGDAALCERVYERALLAHRAAQGGGSGVDVAASAYGGVLVARRVGGELSLNQVALPSGLHFQIWACAGSASTAELLARIAAFATRDPAAHRACMGAQSEAACAALEAVQRDQAADFVAAIDAQASALSALGEAAGANIVTPELAELARLARKLRGAFLPAGAGGGDIAYYVGRSAPPRELAECARALGLWQVELGLGARGVHAL